jgi:AraC-like DNA-binding protein
MHIVEAIPNALRADRHVGEYEIHYVLSGTLSFWVGDRTYEVRPGMTFFTQPAELHGGVDATLQPGEWYWLRLRFPPGNQPLPELSHKSSKELKKALTAIKSPLFAGSLQLRSCFARLLEEYRHQSVHSMLMARLVLHELLIALVRDHARSQAASENTSPFISAPIQQAVSWIQEHLIEELPCIDEIAARVGLSESHFRRRFSDEIGFSPLEYVSWQRIQRAKQLLVSDEISVTKLAYDLGFQSSAYFTQVFRKLTGMTPSHYRTRYGSRDANALPPRSPRQRLGGSAKIDE